MSDDSKIEWTDATWNPTRGCRRTAPAGSKQSGCGDASGGGCYAERTAARFCGPGQPYEGLITLTANGPRWSGAVKFVEDHLYDPLRWQKPRRIFVDSMSDLFYDGFTDDQRDQVLAVMLLSPRHTFQCLTKRAAAMRRYLSDAGLYARVLRAADAIRDRFPRMELSRIGIENPATSPARWIWLGVSVENQAAADERIPELLATPAAVRWISAEPLIGAVDLGLPRTWLVGATARKILRDTGARGAVPAHLQPPPSLDWLVMGAESGTGARAADPAWFRGLAEQCRAAGVPVFFKQGVVGGCVTAGPGSITKRGGLVGLPLLDGVQHSAMPEVTRG